MVATDHVGKTAWLERYSHKKINWWLADRVGWGNLCQWGNLGHFWFSLISPKQNGLTAGAASMDCISPLPREMSAVVPSAFCS